MTDNMIVLSLLLMIIAGSSYLHINAYCLYGDAPDCAFRCNCADKSLCGDETSLCASCDWGVLYRWRRPGCQIGNVGYGKAANFTVNPARNFTVRFPATAAFDGVKYLAPPDGSLSPNCAYPTAPEGQSAEWWGDLGGIYSISSFVIYPRKDCCYDALQQFSVTVYTSSDQEVQCGYHHDTVRSPVTIDCGESLIGRYVHIMRHGGVNIHNMVLCEVVIVGHRYIDCSSCPGGVTCNHVTGCAACSGKYQPECRQACGDGRYGTNCRERCGRCKDGTPCSKRTGNCLGGCQQWWIDTTCKTNIVPLSRSYEASAVVNQSSDAITIQWEKIGAVAADMAQYYGYSVYYKVRDMAMGSRGESQGDLANYQKAGDVDYKGTATTQWRLEELKFNTWYSVLVVPYRQHQGETEYGTAYPEIETKTNCADPEKPVIVNTEIVEADSGLPNVTIIYKPRKDILSNCEEISQMTLQYRFNMSDELTAHDITGAETNFTLVPEAAGDYHIQLIVQNNEGYTATSDERTVIVTLQVEHKPTAGPGSNLTFIGASVGVSVCLVAIAILLVLAMVMVYKRCNRSPGRAEYDNRSYVPGPERAVGTLVYHNGEAAANTHGSEVSPADNEGVMEESLYANSGVSIVNFEAYVKRRMANIQNLYAEYRTLPQEDPSRCLVAQTEDNKKKNRFQNIFAYDANRVVLEGSEEIDYINANYITGYSQPREYIATQGTKKNTWEDFWRMMWQEKANRIVMLANVEENGKRRVDPYFPERSGDSVTMGDFGITTDSVEVTADYTTRTMSVRKQNAMRTVYQFHFTTWEDKNKPVYGPMSLLAFCDKVHSLDAYSKGPMVVHCSAGVGRTGTFIALDILMKMAAKEKSLDVYSCVQRLRNERMFMVQTRDQYVFLHTVLVDFIKYGNKSYDCQKFRDKFATLCASKPDKDALKSIEVDFKLLYDLKKSPSSGSKDGEKSENLKKNRNKKLIPRDSDRLFVQNRKGSNYINAVNADSFHAHNSYVVTQMPLPHTVADFWQLVLDQKCRSIVMLNSLDRQDQSCELYWPEEEGSTQTHGQVKVELVAINNQERVTSTLTRDFRITEIVDKQKYTEPETFVVRHFQLLSWPQFQDLPNRGHILDLLDLIQSWKDQLQLPADKCKSLVHCFDGGSHSGMFCGASFVLDKVRSEQSVDAFLAARYVSRRRPEFFSKLLEYQFLYQIASESLSKYNEYANV